MSRSEHIKVAQAVLDDEWPPAEEQRIEYAKTQALIAIAEQLEVLNDRIQRVGQ